MEKIANQKAWLLVLPVFALVAFSAVIPLMTVVNYSVQDTFGNNPFFWNGVGWYHELLDPSTELGGRFFASLWRNLVFSAIVLAIQIPLGIVVALAMPRDGWGVAVLAGRPGAAPAHPVERRRHDLADLRPLRHRPAGLDAEPRSGFDYNYVANPIDAWLTIIVMDVWHWTSLVALLCYAGLKSIPEAYYQAARIDGASRWAVFTAIQLPKMKRVLLIAVLLRFMDSFMIYTEPFVVTGGGPGNSTTFLSIELVKLALGQFDLGKAAAMSIVYNADHHDRVLGVLHRHDQCRQRAPIWDKRARRRRAVMYTIPGRHVIMVLFLIFLMLPIYWLINMSFKTNIEIISTMTLWPDAADAGQLPDHLHRSELVLRLHQLAEIRRHQHDPVDLVRAAGRLRLLALPLPRRQAPVLLAAVEPDGAAGGVRAAVLQSLFGDQPVRHALGGGAGALPVQRAAGRVDPRRLHLQRAARDRRDRVPRRLLLPALLREDPDAADRLGVGVAAFFCFMFSWVELLLARTLTSVNAKPIAATMTRTVSAAGMDWGLLAAAGVLTIVPGALVIWFVRNYIARGFALGRV